VIDETILWGGTGHARVLHEALHGSGTRVVAIFDNRDIPSPIADIPLFRGESGLRAWLAARRSRDQIYFAIAIGGANGRDRLEVFDQLYAYGLIPRTIIHSAGYVAEDASLGFGCQVLAGAIVSSHARLGNCVIVNTAASVDHDCVIASGVHIAPGARLAGEITVGECAFIGTGAVVLPRKSIGVDAVVGAGAVVVDDVPARCTVAGNPARPIVK
jgi:sugar O-acyltransferase (sialic acid O-acetyltransferase NeuD family)